MKVGELIEALSGFDPELLVVGYCERSEDDFIVQSVELDNTGENGITFYNQGDSCMAEKPAQTVVVLH